MRGTGIEMPGSVEDTECRGSVGNTGYQGLNKLNKKIMCGL